MISSLHKFRKKSGRLFCYGIGQWGKLISIYCKNHRLYIDGYLVTSLSEDMQKKNKVNCVSNFLFQPNDGIILATCVEKNVEEMKKNLYQVISDDKLYMPFEHEDFIQYFSRYLEKRRRNLSNERKLKLFDYQAISAPILYPSLSTDSIINRIDSSNRCYGHDCIVKKRFNLNQKDIRRSTILHSTHINESFTVRELNPPNGHLFCMSEYVLRNYKKAKNICPLGPYIWYVKPLISMRKIIKFKQRFGKTLFVFPSHIPMKNKGSSFSVEHFIIEIERIKNCFGFQTVLVSMGPDGGPVESRKLYNEYGYMVVTAGNSYDRYYLNRLRTYIELSDVAMGNDSVTTIIGYCIALGRPYYYYPMELQGQYAQLLNQKAGYGNCLKNIEEIKEEIRDVFGTYNEQITPKQIRFVEKYWGGWNK